MILISFYHCTSSTDEAPKRKAGILTPPTLTITKPAYPVPAEIDEMTITLYDTECRRDKNLNHGKNNCGSVFTACTYSACHHVISAPWQNYGMTKLWHDKTMGMKAEPVGFMIPISNLVHLLSHLLQWRLTPKTEKSRQCCSQPTWKSWWSGICLSGFIKCLKSKWTPISAISSSISGIRYWAKQVFEVWAKDCTQGRKTLAFSSNFWFVPPPSDKDLLDVMRTLNENVKEGTADIQPELAAIGESSLLNENAVRLRNQNSEWEC